MCITQLDITHARKQSDFQDSGTSPPPGEPIIGSKNTGACPVNEGTYLGYLQ
jgi:hypothetical protein